MGKKTVEKKKNTKTRVGAKAPKAPVDNSVDEDKKLPTFEGAQVEEVLQEGTGNGRFNRCRMSDGTNKDVPVELF